LIVGTHTAISQTNIVINAPKDLAFSLDIKRQRMRDRQFNVLGCIEQIIFENDAACSLDSPEARKLGRRLYWRERAPLLARTMPEEDLVFTQALQLPLPNVPDPLDTNVNPYSTDQSGKSLWKPGDKLNESRSIPQRLEEIASSKYRNFLVFQPVAQIILLMAVNGAMQFGAMGSHRQPLSSLTGWDNRKMALLIDPRNGESFLTGGRVNFEF
jgi:hypothetical protein